MSATRQTITGIAKAALFPISVVGIAATAPLLNNQFMTMIDGRILTLAWWMAVPLGSAAAIIWTRSAWAGVVLGVLSAIGFVLSFAMVDFTREIADVMLDAATWVSSVVMLAVPWMIGMVFGTTSLHKRPKRLDGTSPEDGSIGF
ncbi:MAG: hypothetical protein EG823_01375 [Actinobacteria bacterium]|nr:hypothetical protein [Actinomycetota bacterium]